jgi:hypothetical protein
MQPADMEATPEGMHPLMAGNQPADPAAMLATQLMGGGM